MTDLLPLVVVLVAFLAAALLLGRVAALLWVFGFDP